MSADRIERETFIAAPRERVWEVITQAEHVGRWFGDAGAEIDLRPGGAMALTWQKHGTAHAVVEAVEEPARFAFRWAMVGDEVAPGKSTLVDFSLVPEADGTRLRVVESGFASLDVSEEERVAKFEGNTEGWRLELGDLVDYLAQSPALR